MGFQIGRCFLLLFLVIFTQINHKVNIKYYFFNGLIACSIGYQHKFIIKTQKHLMWSRDQKYHNSSIGQTVRILG